MFLSLIYLELYSSKPQIQYLKKQGMPSLSLLHGASVFGKGWDISLTRSTVCSGLGLPTGPLSLPKDTASFHWVGR